MDFIINNQNLKLLTALKYYHELEDVLRETIKSLFLTIQIKDSYTHGHLVRVFKYVYLISNKMGLSTKECEELQIAGILHDIGKIAVNNYILLKPRELTDQEFEIITAHPVIGANILKSLDISDYIVESIRYHHKRYDLKGYPRKDNLKYLPLGAAILSVADAFDAMTTCRPYKKPLSVDEAIRELIKNKGSQFHPDVVDIMDEFHKNNKDVLSDIALKTGMFD